MATCKTNTATYIHVVS